MLTSVRIIDNTKNISRVGTVARFLRLVPLLGENYFLAFRRR